MDIFSNLRKCRKGIAGFSIVALLLTLVGVQSALAQTFNDVPPSAWEYDVVETAVEQGWIDVGDEFRPNDYSNRAEIMKMLLEAIGAEIDPNFDAGFTDVPEDVWFAEYINTGAKLGIIEGYRDAEGNLTGEAGPGGTTNRAEITKMAVNAFGLPTLTEGGPHFPDVPENVWFYDYVETAYSWSVLDGYENGKFGPGDAVTRSQAVKIIVNSGNPTQRPGEEDTDGDGVLDAEDNCPADENAEQLDTDEDGDGDACDDDDDDDEVADADDNCPLVANAEQEDEDADGEGDACDLDTLDTDEDGIVDALDNCPEVANDDQADADGDGVGDACEVAEVSDADFSAAVASDSPAYVNGIPNNSFAVPFAKYTFTNAEGSEDVKVTHLTVGRSGLGQDAMFSNIYIYNGASRLTDGRTLSTTTHETTFNLGTNAITVKGGASVTLTIATSIAGSGYNNTSSALYVPEGGVTAVGVDSGGAVTAGGTYPLIANTISISGTVAGTLTVSAGTTPPSTVRVGDQGADFGQIRLAANTYEDILVTHIRIENKGNNSGNLANIVLTNDKTGDELASIEALSGDYGDFDLAGLEAGGLLVPDNVTERINITADVITYSGGTSDQIRFELDELEDIQATGQLYIFPAAVAGVKAFTSSTNTTISGSQLTMAFQKPDITSIAQSTTDAVLAELVVTNRGEEIKVKQFNFDVLVGASTPAEVTALTGNAGVTAESINNARLVSPSGTAYGGVDVALAGCTSSICTNASIARIVIGDDFYIPKSDDTQIYQILGNVDTNAVDGQKVQLRFRGMSTAGTTQDGQYIEIEGASTGETITDIVPGTGAISSNAVTIQKATLDVTITSTPAAEFVVKGVNKKPVLGIQLKTNDSGDVEVRKLQFAKVGAWTATNAGTLYVYEDSIDADDENLLQSNTGTWTTGGATINFSSFNHDLIISSGGYKKIILAVDVSSTATTGSAGNSPTWVDPSGTSAACTANCNLIAFTMAPSSTTITAIDAKGSSIESAQINSNSATVLNGTASDTVATNPTKFLEVLAGGTLTVTQDNETPVAGQLQLGDDGVDLLRINLNAQYEDINVTKFRIYTTNNSYDPQIERLYLWNMNKDEEVGSSSEINSEDISSTPNYAEWTISSNPVLVEKDANVDILVKADLNTSNDVATSGTAIQVMVGAIEAEGTQADIIPTFTTDSTASTRTVATVYNSTTGVLVADAATGLGVGDIIICLASTGNEQALILAASGASLTIKRAINQTTSTDECWDATSDTFTVYSGVLSNSFTPYDILPTVAVHESSPTGDKEARAAMEIFKFTVNAGNNTADPRHQKVQIESITLSVDGSVDVSDFVLYDLSDNSTVASANGSFMHEGSDGFTSKIIFDVGAASVNSDKEISESSSKTYYVKANVASAASGGGKESLSVSIANLGTSSSTTFNDIIWRDNSADATTTDVDNIGWVDQSPNNVTPSSSMIFNATGGTADTPINTPTIIVADGSLTAATGLAGYIHVYFNIAVDTTTGTTNADLTTADFAYLYDGTNAGTISAISHTAGDAYAGLTVTSTAAQDGSATIACAATAVYDYNGSTACATTAVTLDTDA